MPDPVEFPPKLRRRSVHRRRGLYGILIPRDLPGRPEVTRTVRSAGGGRLGPLPSPISEKYLAADGPIAVTGEGGYTPQYSACHLPIVALFDTCA
jgi:hypothetical protein